MHFIDNDSSESDALCIYPLVNIDSVKFSNNKQPAKGQSQCYANWSNITLSLQITATAIGPVCGEFQWHRWSGLNVCQRINFYGVVLSSDVSSDQ